MTPHHSPAFSLVELSIVLVVLGLLTGGVLAGPSLIHAAELRNITVEVSAFKTAINTFKEKYSALPGDMSNAVSFWGRADNGSFSGQCANPYTDGGNSIQTCNGDGNGKVGIWQPILPARYYEAFRSWQHLANAGLITGKYTGTMGNGGFSHTQIGINGPASAYNNGGWVIENYENHPGDTEMFAGKYGNYFEVGAETPTNAPENALLTPEDAWNIDKKG
jgi:prepilin-type N-terminal cleavage/methylation domain-containing protein